MNSLLTEIYNVYTFLSGLYPPKPTFNVEQIPDLSGQVIIVTGGNTGIGKETVKALLNRDAKVYIASRNRIKSMHAIEDLERQTGRRAYFIHLDLSSLDSVHSAAEGFARKEKELHALFNNAGIMACPSDLVTADGYDMQFGTNVVGPYLFTEMLMPLLIRGAASSPDHHARIITTSSGGAYLTTLHWGTFRDGPLRRKLFFGHLYNQSKFANVVVAREFAKRYADKGIISLSLNPGNISTELQRYIANRGSILRVLMDTLVLYPPSFGALTQLWAGTMPDALNYNGEFLIPWARLGKCRNEAYDPVIGERLWNWLQEELKPWKA